MAAFLSKLAFVCRCAGSYAALAAGVWCLGWLALRLEGLPGLRLNVWGLDDTPWVVVDAGHGGHDGGAVAGGFIEKNLALEIARKVRDHLAGHGLKVKMTRDADVFLTLEARSQMAADGRAAAFVSVHLNTTDTGDAAGIETYHAARKSLNAVREAGKRGPRMDDGERLARNVQQHVCLSTGAENRGVKQRNYAVVTHTPCPAVLVECGFLTNAAEAKRLATAAYQERVAEGVARGVAEFLKARQPGKEPAADVKTFAMEQTKPAVADEGGSEP